MRTTTDKAVAAFRLLNAAKTSKLEPSDHMSLIRALRPLRPVATEWDEFVKDAVKRLRPEGYDTHETEMTRLRSMPAEEQAAALKDEKSRRAVEAEKAYNEAIEECLKTELDKETELSFTPLSDEALGRLMASNDWTAEQALAVADFLGTQPETEPNPEPESK